MTKPISISEFYGSNTSLSMKLDITGKSSITTFLSILSQSDMVEYSKLKEVKENWIKSIEDENKQEDLRKEVEATVREVYPNIEFINIGVSYRTDQWGDENNYCSISYNIKNDGNAVPKEDMEYTLREKLRKHKVYDISLYGYFEEKELKEIWIQPLSFNGYKFKQIPFELESEMEYDYRDNERYILVLNNKELNIRLKKNSSFYTELMDYFDKTLRERYTGSREIKEKLMKYIEGGNNTN